MNLVAVLVAVVSALFLAFAALGMVRLVLRAVHASRAGEAEQERALVRELVGLVGLALWMGLAGFWAVTAPATYDVARYAQMSPREQRRLEFGIFWSGAGLVCLAVYALKYRSDRRRRQSDAAVARAIEDWRAGRRQDHARANHER